MSSATMGVGITAYARAPRQSGLKKPRPLRSLSSQAESSSANAEKGPGFQHLQGQSGLNALGDESVGITGDEDLPVCKELAAMSAKLMWKPSEANDASNMERTAFKRQSSVPSTLTVKCEPHNIGSDALSPNVKVRGVQHGRTVSVNCESASAEDTVLLKGRNLPAVSVDCNSNSLDSVNKNFAVDSLRNAEGAIHWEAKPGTVGCESLGSGRGRYHHSKNLASSQSVHNNTKVTSSLHSVVGQSTGTIKTTLRTSKGDELALMGKNMQGILCASRILLKELNASIVKIEMVPDEGGSVLSTDKGCPSDVRKPNKLSQVVKETKELHYLHYSKQELLRLSQSRLSKKPPSSWNVVARTHTGCCVPASEVRSFFHPSSFQPHDGSLVVEEHRERDRHRD